MRQTEDKLIFKIVVITLISKQDKLTKTQEKDMTKLTPYCLFPLNNTR